MRGTIKAQPSRLDGIIKPTTDYWITMPHGYGHNYGPSRTRLEIRVTPEEH